MFTGANEVVKKQTALLGYFRNSYQERITWYSMWDPATKTFLKYN